jgi:hypothetical protein
MVMSPAAPGKFGAGEKFGTQANFEQYQISKLLRNARLYDDQREHEQAHDLMTSMSVPHTYREGQIRKHDWHSG